MGCPPRIKRNPRWGQRKAKPAGPPPGTYTLTLRPMPDPLQRPDSTRLRLLLKYAKRQQALECITIRKNA